MAAGMSPVVVRISYGDGSNSESDATYAKLRDAIIEVVPHAQVSLDKSSIDLGSRNYFVVHVNNEQIEGDLPDIRANINKIVNIARRASGGDTFRRSQRSSMFCCIL
ncbi:uncharacterized protein [Dysidea avara]|uniref:uncharacterized protein isoform X2 n=1 Tax=Dysidea avara TaxID=196820 RepID=UPI0033323949